MAEMKLFLGCTIPNRLPYLEKAARIVFDKLGVQTSDAAFACCPEPIGLQTVNQKTWITLAASNLAIAEAEGKDIVSLCNGCTQTLKAANHELKHDTALKSEVNGVLSKVGQSLNGTINVRHFIDVLINDVGIDKIKAAVTKPLTGLKIACHTGCHYARPSKIMQFDDPFEPKYLRALVEALGATVVPYESEWICCGTGAGNTNPDLGNEIAKNKLDDAQKQGAQLMAVNCPACFQQLDGQRVIPVAYITQLMAIAMGETFDSLNMKLHRTKAKELFE
ncbi:MAG: CoB--CoM heterodisulfide reductase subunit B [Candidatus Lokiarchaeota archaeon]|nr:CoB--CoM heterodisulfide reductase subunit B [Candidatus Lokiarchaeota archaeon]